MKKLRKNQNEILSTCLQKRNNISDMAKAFIDEANKKGGKDNVTVVLISIPP